MSSSEITHHSTLVRAKRPRASISNKNTIAAVAKMFIRAVLSRRGAGELGLDEVEVIGDLGEVGAGLIGLPQGNGYSSGIRHLCANTVARPLRSLIFPRSGPSHHLA